MPRSDAHNYRVVAGNGQTTEIDDMDELREIDSDDLSNCTVIATERVLEQIEKRKRAYLDRLRSALGT